MHQRVVRVFNFSTFRDNEARVKELTRILEEAGDLRAQKGYMLLDEMKK